MYSADMSEGLGILCSAHDSENLRRTSFAVLHCFGDLKMLLMPNTLSGLRQQEFTSFFNVLDCGRRWRWSIGANRLSGMFSSPQTFIFQVLNEGLKTT
jgi:hypothetical protein